MYTVYMNYRGESIVIIVLVAFFDFRKKKNKDCIEKSFDRLAGEPLVCPGKWSSWPDSFRCPVVILAALHSIRCLLA